MQLQAYSCPRYFADDWLNAFLLRREGSCHIASTFLEQTQAAEPMDVHTADYRFVYLGYQGSRTLLHADVVRSYSWSINISGKKRCTSGTIGSLPFLS